jgi:hypothetical protein
MKQNPLFLTHITNPRDACVYDKIETKTIVSNTHHKSMWCYLGKILHIHTAEFANRWSHTRLITRVNISLSSLNPQTVKRTNCREPKCSDNTSVLFANRWSHTWVIIKVPTISLNSLNPQTVKWPTCLHCLNPQTTNWSWTVAPFDCKEWIIQLSLITYPLKQFESSNNSKMPEQIIL